MFLDRTSHTVAADGRNFCQCRYAERETCLSKARSTNSLMYLAIVLAEKSGRLLSSKTRYPLVLSSVLVRACSSTIASRRRTVSRASLNRSWFRRWLVALCMTGTGYSRPGRLLAAVWASHRHRPSPSRPSGPPQGGSCPSKLLSSRSVAAACWLRSLFVFPSALPTALSLPIRRPSSCSVILSPSLCVSFLAASFVRRSVCQLL